MTEITKRRYAQRDYAKLSFGWYRDDVLCAIADERKHALAVWPVLIAMSKESSHEETNPTGLVRTTWKRLADACSCKVGELQAVLELMEKGEMLTVESGRLGTIQVQLSQFDKWQNPRHSPADRKAISRENASESHSNVTPLSQGSHTSVTAMSLEESRVEEIKETSDKTSSSDVQEIFDHWVMLTWSGRGRRPMLDPKRTKRIKARLRENFTVNDLCAAISGFASDPWYSGKENGRAQMAIDTILRDAAQVEKGLAMFVGTVNAESAKHAGVGVSVLSGGDLQAIEDLIGRELTNEEESELKSGLRSVDAFLAENGATQVGAA